LNLEKVGYFNLDEVSLQYNIALVHKAEIVQKLFLEQPFTVLEKPIQSPNL